MAIKLAKESTPLWVWLALALLGLGTIGYVGVVSIIEYVMTLS